MVNHKMISKHILVKGKVQGVFFRATAKEVADKLSVAGWIRNTEEGDVEAVVTGEENNVNAFIEWCKKGPDRAKVERVIIDNSANENYTSFKIIRGS